MKSIKFVVRVNRRGARAAEFVQRIDRTPIQTTTNRKLALAMGRFTGRRYQIHPKFPVQPRVSVRTL